MKHKILFIFPILSSVIMTAHFLRKGNLIMAVTLVLLPLLLLSKKGWVMRFFQFLLFIGGLVWIDRTIFLINLRQRLNMPATRLGVIMGLVAVFTLASILVFQNRKIKAIFTKDPEISRKPAVISVVLSFILLSIVRIKVKIPVILIIDRFFPGSGWAEIILLSLYAGWLTEKFIDPEKLAKYRSYIWILFSFVFFSQFVLGILGVEKLLMTGQIHLPVPALIIAGPIFRGGSLFMLILFFSTVLISGPAWCSHLCYIGAWDNLAAKSKKKTKSAPNYKKIQISIFVLVILFAILFRIMGVSGRTATMLAVLFGLIGIPVMAVLSRGKGVMVHCTSYCPMGLVANLAGRINPFRVKIDSSCTDCNLCTESCKYNALNQDDIKKREPGLNCTLCGDCIPVCNSNSLKYKLFKLNPDTARTIFLILIIVLHTIFLGVARI